MEQMILRDRGRLLLAGEDDGVIADNPVLVTVRGVAGVTVHHVLRRVVPRSLGVDDGKKDCDGIGSARGGVLSAEVHLIHLAEGVNEPFQAACGDGFGHIEVGLFAILVGRVMGEVRTDDKEVLRGEVRLEKLRYLLQYIKMR